MGVPPSPRSFGIIELGGKSRQVFGFKGLIGKVFRNKDLAVKIGLNRRIQDFGDGLTPAKRLKLSKSTDAVSYTHLTLPTIYSV